MTHSEPSEVRPPRFRVSKALLNVAASVALLGVLAWFVDLRHLGQVLLSADPALVLAAIAVALADRALMIGKWYPLVRSQGVDIPLLRAARAYLAAGFASYFLPTPVGGDLVRAIALGRQRKKTVEIVSSIVMERLLGLAASGILSAVALAVALESGVSLHFLLPWALAAIAASTAAVTLPLAPRLSVHVRRRLEAYPQSRWAQLGLKFGAAYGLYRHHTSQLLVVGALSVIEQGFPILVFWVLVRALNVMVSPQALIVAVPLALFVARLPIAIGGIGVFEGGLVLLLSLFGVSTVDAVSLALAGRAIELAGALPGAFLWAELVKKPVSYRRNEPTDAEQPDAPEPSQRGAGPSLGNAMCDAVYKTRRCGGPQSQSSDQHQKERPLRIGVMLRHTLSSPGGVGVYTRNLLDNILRIDHKNKYILLYSDKTALGPYQDYFNVEEVVTQSSNKLLWDQLMIPYLAKKYRFDVIFNPKLSIPLFTSRKTVFVLHGSEWFVFDRHFPMYLRLYHNVFASQYLRRADAIIAVSQATVDETTKQIPSVKHKMVTVHHGVSDRFAPITDKNRLEEVRRKYDLPEKFLLYIGQIYTPKNVKNIISAFAHLRTRVPHKLVIIGNQSYKAAQELAPIQEYKLENDVLMRGWVPHDELPAIYNLADVFLFPSRHEGFGIPLLEAMACGCPVVTSTAGSCPEVVGDAAILVDPTDPASIAAATAKILGDPEMARSLRERGLLRAKTFTWEKTARETLAVFEKACMELPTAGAHVRTSRLSNRINHQNIEGLRSLSDSHEASCAGTAASPPR